MDNMKIVNKVLKNVSFIEFDKVRLWDLIEPDHKKRVRKFCKEREIKYKRLKLVWIAVNPFGYERLRTIIGKKLDEIIIKYDLLPITCIIRENKYVPGEAAVSFRSNDEHIDWSKIWEISGGGGH